MAVVLNPSSSTRASVLSVVENAGRKADIAILPVDVATHNTPTFETLKRRVAVLMSGDLARRAADQVPSRDQSEAFGITAPAPLITGRCVLIPLL
jgi:hypothetical protein